MTITLTLRVALTLSIYLQWSIFAFIYNSESSCQLTKTSSLSQQAANISHTACFQSYSYRQQSRPHLFLGGHKT